MPRPFRFQRPSLLDGSIPRPRLLERLGLRWKHRLVTVVAGPGFGKTALLVAATEGSTEPSRRDVWLSCEPADETADHLVAGLAEALGVAASSSLETVCDAVWAQAPDDLCLVLDDIHEIPVGSAGAMVLGRLVTDLAANAHLVVASRDSIPVPLARLAASGQLVRIGEDDLVFDDDEIASFAAARHVDPGILASSGGWPALAELAASAGADLVLDYLWEEVLGRLGAERAQLLARFAAAGGGDDEMVSMLAGRSTSLGEVVGSVPLVQRAAGGWARLHPLWEPALRDVLPDVEAAAARRAAAEVHCRNHRYSLAADLLVEAEAWDDLLALIRLAERAPVTGMGTTLAPSLTEFGRWYRLLPPDQRSEPEAQLAAALELQARDPARAALTFEAAAAGFRARGDNDAELASISHEGLIRWWMNDTEGLLGLFTRVGELAAAGFAAAQVLGAVGVAGWAHLQGDSASVLTVLDGIGEDVDPVWLPWVWWLRSVAHRRDGNLGPAREALGLEGYSSGSADPQDVLAMLRIDWLDGRVEEVGPRLAELYDRYVTTGDRFLARETGLELAGKEAWFGNVERAGEVLAAATALLQDTPSVLSEVLDLIARAAVAVAEADEALATELLTSEVVAGAAALGGPASWYWRDRAAIALVYVLVPATRERWTDETLGPAHLPGLALAKAFVAAREGDLGPVRGLDWPAAGIVRANLPVGWVVELAAAGVAARNPPPQLLLDEVGARAGSALAALASTGRRAPVRAAARRLAKELPPTPPYRLRVGALGPLQVWRDEVASADRDLRRQRVRELLCYMIARRRVRRAAAGEELWSEVRDPASNLRVTLNYLQGSLQPERTQGTAPYFLRTRGEWLELTGEDHLEVDVWELDDRLDLADSAERTAQVTAALDAYRTVLPLWRGEPFADVPYAMWAEPERARLRARYVTAAIRAGELWLAARALGEAAQAAQCAVAADPTSERGYQLQARTFIAKGDRSNARRTLEHCVRTLVDLDAQPHATTLDLLGSLC